MDVEKSKHGRAEHAAKVETTHDTCSPEVLNTFSSGGRVSFVFVYEYFPRRAFDERFIQCEFTRKAECAVQNAQALL